MMCGRGAERKMKWLLEEEAQMIKVVAFQEYRRPLETMSEYKYLGRVLTASDDYWSAVVANLSKAWRRWEQLSGILERGGTDPWTSGTFYKSVVQATLMFGAGTWVGTPRIGRTLGVFHHKMSCRLK